MGRASMGPQDTPTGPAPPQPGTWWATHRILIVGLALLLASFSIYQINLGEPPVVIGDEDTYVKVARNMTNGVFLEDSQQGPRPQNHVHPPLGKLVIAAGLLVQGKPNNEYIHGPDPGAANAQYIHGKTGDACGYYNPDCRDDARTWRLANTVLGAAGVVAAYVIALRLFHRLSAGIAAAVLLHLDGMYYLHARIAMLDLIAVSFALMSVALAFPRRHWSRLVAGLAFGAAVATKVNSLFLLPAIALILFLRAPIPSARRDDSTWQQFRPWLLRIGTTLLFAIIIPALVYVASYYQILRALEARGGWGFAWKQWWFVQQDAVLFHRSVYFDHFHSSQPIEWIPMIRPMRYFAQFFGDKVSDIYAIGNPFLWWTATLALIIAPARILVRNRDVLRRVFTTRFLADVVFSRFPYSRDLFVLLAAGLFWCAYLPWFLIDRTMFLYYMTFIVPFFAIFAGGLVAEAWSRPGGWRLLATLYMTGALFAFLILLPLVTGEPMDPMKHDAFNSAVPWIHSP